jgi:hypothetical protein
MNSQQPQYEEEEKKSPGKIIIMVIVAIWIILGIAGFIMSIVCFGRSGSTSQHVVGLLLAIFFGNFLISLSEIKKLRHYKFAMRIYMFPFFWIFYFVVPDYCKRIFS